MKTLSIPAIESSPEKIFEECVCSYRDVKKTKELLDCKEHICRDSKLFDELIPNRIDEFNPKDLPISLTSKDLTKVYDQKFAAKDSPGRKYYDVIKNSVRRGICPICGIRMVSTLDHYLPKSKVPTLCVTPNNLIPSCKDCNIDKHSEISFNPSEIPLHLYFDEIPQESWLYVKFGNNFEPLYFIECPNSYDHMLKQRLENHLDYYKLHTLYSSHAAQEIAGEIDFWKELIISGGISSLKEFIEHQVNSLEKYDINFWKTALYRGLLQNLNELYKYIQSI